MFNLGWTEVILILVAAILVFGPKKIPQLGSTLGKTLRGFKEEISKPEEESDDKQDYEG
jgi:sec-independent protein translocase protein TatA